MNVRVSTLENGLRLAVAPVPHSESAVAGLWVASGSRLETRRQCGLSHFVEHMLFKGTRRRSARQISEDIEGCGGGIDAFTQPESTCYFARVPAGRLDRAFDVIVDMYLHARLARSDIEKERGVILDEIAMYRDQPPHLVQEMLGRLLWHNHPLGRPLGGEPETVAAFDRPHVAEFKRRTYGPDRCVMVFAGAVDPAACERLARPALGRLPSPRRPAAAPVTRRVAQHRAACETREVEQAQIALGFRLFGHHDRRRHALKLLNVVLGENMSSRLFQSLREQEGLAYSVQSGYSLYSDTGALVVSAGVDPARIERAMRLAGKEMARLVRAGIGPAELRRAKEYAVGQFRLGLETAVNQMMWAGESLLMYGRCIPPEETVGHLQAVRPEEIRALAATVFAPAAVSAATVSPRPKQEDEQLCRAFIARLGEHT